MNERVERTDADPIASILTPRTIVGLGLVSWGLMHLLYDLGLLSETVEGIPAVTVIAIGVSILWRGGISNVAGWIVTGVGVWLLLDTLDLVDVSIFELWPVALIVWGIVLIRRSSRDQSDRATSSGDPGADFDEMSIFSDQEVRPAALESGSVTAFLSTRTFNLTRTELPERATLNVFAIWSSVKLIIPPDCAVDPGLFTFWGGLEDKTWSTETPSRRVLLTGFVWMAGIEVTNPPPGEKSHE